MPELRVHRFRCSMIHLNMRLHGTTASGTEHKAQSGLKRVTWASGPPQRKHTRTHTQFLRLEGPHPGCSRQGI